MNPLTGYLRELYRGTLSGWQRFWFAPADPATLGLIRILAGAMLFYTHLVWSLDLERFFGRNAWISPEAVASFKAALHGPDGVDYAWSYFWLIDSPAMLWTVHIAALVVFALLTVGLFSRTMSVLAWLAAVSYVNRVPGALFGLDQINVMLAMYLMLGPSGAAYSLDRWLARRRARQTRQPEPAVQTSIGANVAIRLIQVHMCVIYLSAGLSKLLGEPWWTGDAMWLTFGNLEYQTLDMTWLASWPLLWSVMAYTILAWEISYAALVWPRLTRPIVLFMAIPLHMGIAVCLGMVTFGLVMLIGNLAFVSPALVRYVLDRRVPEETAKEAAASAERRVKARPAARSVTR